MRGSMQQRAKGSWRLRYDGPPDADGDRKQISETVRGTRKDAERVLRERLAAIESGAYVARSNQTVDGFLTSWLQTYVATNTTLRTQQGYSGHLRRYVVPQVGNLQLQDLRPQHIQAMYAAMLDGGLSARTVVHVHRILKEALSHAVKWGLLVRNPSDSTTPPRPERRQLEMWDAETVHRFLEAAAASPFRDLYHLAVLTGMRRSELCGLKWDHVDLSTGKLSVVSTLQRIIGKGLVEGQPKTAKSRRSIALSPTAVTLLHSVRGRQIELRLAVGPAWQGKGHVFTEMDGRPVDGDRSSKDFARIVRRAELPHLTLHGLRHAHATLMLMSGVHPKIVSERLGHSNIAVTMDTYSHVLPGLQEAAAIALDERLGGRVQAS